MSGCGDFCDRYIFRSYCRIFRWRCGRGDHAYRRYDDLFPRPCTGHRHCRYAGAKPGKCRYLHRGCKLDEVCPPCKKYGFESQEESLYRSCSGKRNKDLENSSCTRSSQHGNPDGGNCGSRYRNHDAGTGFPFIPWIWCNCTDTGVGTDAE